MLKLVQFLQTDNHIMQTGGICKCFVLFVMENSSLTQGETTGDLDNERLSLE